jgi:hypothetical protein
VLSAALLSFNAIAKKQEITSGRSMLARHQIKFAIARGDAPPPACDKQFATTSKTGTEYVASRRSEVPDRAQMAAELRCRKINNTKTSISFGNAPIKWETDAQVIWHI